MARPRFLPDNFSLMILATVALASMFPARPAAAQALDLATTGAVSLLFFLHGAKLSREGILAGIGNWRLHLLVALMTFAVFPLVGLALQPVLEPLVTPDLYLGVLYLCTLPATVQSAIAFVSIARGNVPAAVCSASASSILGIVITPLLVGVLLHKSGAGGSPWTSVTHIGEELLLPFVLGHLLRSRIAPLLQRHGTVLKGVDQGSILLVVYAAFSHAVNAGLWHRVPAGALAGLFVVSAVVLGAILAISTGLSRRLGFSKDDEITIVFCGSKKSLVNGIPMANVLFAPALAGAIVLPLMLFHQLQLMVCAALAQRYAKRGAWEATGGARMPG